MNERNIDNSIIDIFDFKITQRAAALVQFFFFVFVRQKQKFVITNEISKLFFFKLGLLPFPLENF